MKPTTEEIQGAYELFGDSMPNYEQEPLRFMYYIKLYRYIKGIQ